MQRTRVLVIGGGIAGVSIGSELATDHDVVVLEAEPTLAAHSTGRSAALFVVGYGPAPVRTLTRASEQEFLRIGCLPDSTPLLTPRGALLTAWDADTAAALSDAIALDPQTVEVTAAEAAHLCPALRTEGLLLAAYDESARDIDVGALHQHFVKELRARGGITVTDAAVVAASREPEGWAVACRDGRRWKTDVLVNASGAWGDQVAGLCGLSGHALVPRRRTVVLSRPSTPVERGWPVVADASETWYFKPEGDALLLSPADETPVEAGDARPDPLDVATALERVNAVTTLGLRSVQTSWAGLRTFAPDGAPVVGAHPEDPSVFCFLGQGGYGIQMAPALARAGAELFRSGSLPDTTLMASLHPGRTPAAFVGH